MKNNKVKKRYSKRKILIFIILLLMLITSCIYIIQFYINKNKTEEPKKIIEKITIDDEKNNISERILKLKKLHEENNDIIGWIEIEGTNINYPVLQTNNNDFYLNHDYQKKYNKNGSIFLDKDYDWNIPSSNLLIYGHNSQDGTMFKDLLNYKNENYYKEHPKIRFTTLNEDAEYEIIAVFLSRVYYKREENVFRYYKFINAENENEYNSYVENSKKSSLYNIEKTPKYKDQLITLSTCSNHTEDGRLAVVGYKKS